MHSYEKMNQLARSERSIVQLTVTVTVTYKVRMSSLDSADQVQTKYRPLKSGISIKYVGQSD